MVTARLASALAPLVIVGACATHKAAPSAAAPKPATSGPEASADVRSMRSTTPPSDVERIYRLGTSAPQAVRGPEDAKVTLEVCSDFECPFCARLVPTLDELTHNYGEFVRIVWRDCPLPFHEFALGAAEAGREVLAQGGAKAFWAYHDRLFAHQAKLAPEDLVGHAATIEGVDPAGVRSALADHRHIPAIKSELMGLVDSGATSQGFGTPASFVNGRLISGAQPYEVFEDAVERALAETPEQRTEALARSDAAFPMARARHIMIQWKGAEGADASITRSKDEARQRAEDVRKKLAAPGSDFASLAHEYSNCPSAAQGGELGRVTRGEFVPEFEAVLFTLSPKQLSDVVESPFGYHLIEREE